MKLDEKVVLCFFIIVTLTDVTNAREEWIDPHDLNIKIKSRLKTDDEDRKFCDCNNKFSKDQSTSHLKKLITMITSMTHFDRNSDIYKGVIDIQLNIDDYDFLRNLVTTDLHDVHVLSKLSTVLDKSLVKSIYSTYFFTIGEYLYLALNDGNTLLLLGLIVLLFILWRIQPQNYELKTLMKLFFPLVYFSDFVLRYKAKLEIVEIDKFIEFENYKVCDPDNLGWFDWIYDKFTGYCKDNKRDYLMSQRSSFHFFTPLSVISDQFDVIINVLKHLGTGFGSFMWALMSEMPWYMKPVAGVFSFVLVIIILLMFGSYTLDVYPKFNLFHLFHFEVSKKPHIGNNQSQQDCISGENLKTLIANNRDRPITIVAGPSVQKKTSVCKFRTKPKFIPTKKISKAIVASNDEKHDMKEQK